MDRSLLSTPPLPAGTPASYASSTRSGRTLLGDADVSENSGSRTQTRSGLFATDLRPPGAWPRSLETPSGCSLPQKPAARPAYRTDKPRLLRLRAHTPSRPA